MWRALRGGDVEAQRFAAAQFSTVTRVPIGV